MKVCDFSSPVEHTVFRVLRADLPLIVEVRCSSDLLGDRVARSIFYTVVGSIFVYQHPSSFLSTSKFCSKY
jgi:hypothetical protein